MPPSFHVGRGFFLFRFPRSATRSLNALSLSLSLSLSLPLRPCQLRHPPFQQNPLTAGSPLEAMKKKSEAAYTWVQDETAEIANTGYRLKTIYQQNKTVPRKYLTRKLEFSFSGSLYLEKERGGEKRNEGEHSQGACVLVSQKKSKQNKNVTNNSA